MSRPSFLIIGAQKCGTTTLHGWLNGHPAVSMSSPKELHFLDQHFARGFVWYQEHFSGPCAGEATPYYLFHPLAAARCAEVMPWVKLIVLLRDPVERAQSHYHHVHRQGVEPLSFSEALVMEGLRLRGEVEKLSEDPRYHSLNHQKYSYLSRGLYAEQLAVWRAHFPDGELLVLPSRMLRAARQQVLDRVCDFLGVPRAELRKIPDRNVGAYAPMDPQLDQALRRFYAPHNARLLSMLGADPVWREEITHWGTHDDGAQLASPS